MLAHPFLTNKKAARLGGDAAEYDVFLSYRRNDSDLINVEALYNALTEKHLLVWWDKKCMHPGEKWEEKFFEGLSKSSVFVPVTPLNFYKIYSLIKYMPLFIYKYSYYSYYIT